MACKRMLSEEVKIKVYKVVGLSNQDIAKKIIRSLKVYQKRRRLF